MSKLDSIVEEIADNYVRGRLPEQLRHLVDNTLDDYDKVIVRLLGVGDCLKRCYDSMGPRDWKRGDLLYQQDQLTRAREYINSALQAIAKQREDTAGAAGEEMPL